MRITEVNPNSQDMIEAMVLFEPTQVKHVDAQTFDYENPEIYQLRLGDNGFLGELGEAIIDNPDVDIPQMRASILNAAERMGAPKPIREFINKTARGEARIRTEDGQAQRRARARAPAIRNVRARQKAMHMSNRSHRDFKKGCGVATLYC